MIGAASYTASVALSPGGFDNWNWGVFFTSVGTGAISGAASASIGGIFKGIGSFGHEVLRAVAHGSFGGYLSLMTNGNFVQGFSSGSLGSLGGSAFSAWGGNIAGSTVGTVAFGALSGGIGAALSGGDFWQGAGVGATIALLNHAAHRVLEGPDDPPGKKSAAKKTLIRARAIASKSNNTVSTIENVTFSIKKGLEYGISKGLSDIPYATKLLKYVKTATKTSGYIGDFINVIDYVGDISDFSDGKISGIEFGYKTFKNSVIVAAGFLGEGIGGVLIEGAFSAGEAAYYYIKPIVIQGITDTEHALRNGWIPGRK